MNPGAFVRFIRIYPQAAKLWASETIASFGSYFFTIALMWYVFAKTGSGLATGLVAVASFLPTVVLGPWFGVLADRLNRRQLMLGANLSSAVLAAVLAGTVIAGWRAIWIVYLTRGLMGVSTTLYDPARAALFPELVGAEDLMTGHALFHSSQQVARLVGSAVGGLVVALVGAGLTMTLDAATFAVAAVLVSGIAYQRKSAEDAKRPSVWASAMEGWSWLRRRPVLLVMLGIAMVSNIALGPTNVLPPMLIRDTFHASAAALGLFDAAVGLGIVVGGIVIGMFTIRRVGLSMVVALGLEMVGLLVVSIAPTPAIADMGNFCLGVGLVSANAPSGAMLQTLVPSDLLGRVSSVSVMVSGLAVPITLGGVGLVGDTIGAHRSFGAAAALMAATVVTAILVPEIRNFRLPQASSSTGTASIS